MNHFFKIVHGGIQAEDSHEKSKNVIVYNHSAKSTIYKYTFGVQNNILWSYLLACICVGRCFGVHFNDVYERYTVYSNR